MVTVIIIGFVLFTLCIGVENLIYYYSPKLDLIIEDEHKYLVLWYIKNKKRKRKVLLKL